MMLRHRRLEMPSLQPCS